MKIMEQEIKGVFEIEPNPHEDHRGFFMRTYDDKIFKEYGLDCNWVQENHSYSKSKGMLRGLHFQYTPHEEAKLIRAVTGEIFMAYVDLRKDSSSFSKWNSAVISEANKKQLFVPRGFALGMCTLSDNCTLLYKMDNYYVPESQGGIKWDDPQLNIEWPITEAPIMSEKDQEAISFDEFLKQHKALEVNG